MANAIKLVEAGEPIAQSALYSSNIIELGEQFERIFTDAAPDYQKAMGAAASRALFARISRSLGAPISYEVKRVQVNHMPQATIIVVQGQGTRLVAYTARSPVPGS
jgi:hypothetical protein